jgi:hypothetical protein
VTELPYQVNKAELIKTIAGLVRDKKIDGITDVREESDRNGMRVVIDVRRDAQPQVVLNMLFKHTELQKSDGIIFLALVNGEPKILNLKEMLFYYLEHQKEVVERRTRYELRKAQEREHILQGLVIALANIDALKSAIDSAIDSFMRDGKSVGDGVQIDNGALESWHTSLLLDCYPFSGMWRITAGYAWGSAKLNSDIFGEIEQAPNQRFYFYLAGDHYYYNGNNFGGMASIDWKFHGPYLGTGLDIDLFCGFLLFLDAGVVFTNRPAKLYIDIPHEQLYMYNKDTGAWNPITIPALDNDVARATREGNDKLSDFKFFPMVKVGFMYRF